MGGVRMCASSMDAPKKSPWCAFTEASSSHLAALRVVMVGEAGAMGNPPVETQRVGHITLWVHMCVKMIFHRKLIDGCFPNYAFRIFNFFSGVTQNVLYILY